MKAKYVLETGALIVFLQDKCAQIDQVLIERHAVQRRKLRHLLDNKKGPFAVPAYAYAEFLFGIPEEYKDYLSGLPATLFRVAPMSERVAIHASTIKSKLVGARSMAEAAKSYGQTKNLLQIDIFILATLVSEGKNAILITRDGPLKKHAYTLQMQCMHIDELPDPNDIIPEPVPASPELPISAPAPKPKQMGIFDGLKEALNDILAEGVKAELVLTDKEPTPSTDPEPEAKPEDSAELIASADSKLELSITPVTEMQSPPEPAALEPAAQAPQEQLDKPKRRRRNVRKLETDSEAQTEEPT